MNSYYLDKGNLKIIRGNFLEKGMIRLDGFVEENLYERLKREIEKEKFIHEKIATKFSYSACKLPALAREILDSPELRFIVQNIYRKKLGKLNLEVRKFGHRDYTLIHDSILKKDTLEFIFFVCEQWNPKWGGNKVYVKKEKSYVFPPRGNSFVLVENKKELKGFVQYVNHLSKKNKFTAVEGFFSV